MSLKMQKEIQNFRETPKYWKLFLGWRNCKQQQQQKKSIGINQI